MGEPGEAGSGGGAAGAGAAVEALLQAGAVDGAGVKGAAGTGAGGAASGGGGGNADWANAAPGSVNSSETAEMEIGCFRVTVWPLSFGRTVLALRVTNVTSPRQVNCDRHRRGAADASGRAGRLRRGP